MHSPGPGAERDAHGDTAGLHGTAQQTAPPRDLPGLNGTPTETDSRQPPGQALRQQISGHDPTEATIAQHVLELDTLYATSPTGLFQFDADLRFVRVNAWTAAINGLSIEAHIGRTLHEVLNPELAVEVERMLRRILQTGEPVLDLELQGTTAALSGQRDWLASYYPMRNAGGKVVGVQGVVQDITQRKRRERDVTFLAQLQTGLPMGAQTADTMRAVGRHIADHLKVSRCNFIEIDGSAGVATVVADHCAAGQQSVVGRHDLTHYLPPEELRQLAAGRPLAIPDVREALPAAAAANFEALDMRALANAPYLRDGTWTFSLAVQHHQPREWLADELDLLGQLAERVCLLVERNRAEDALRASEQRFRSLVTTLSPVVWTCNAAGSVVEDSPSWREFTGQTVQQRLGWGWADAVHPDDRGATLASWQRALEATVPLMTEYRLRRHDGEYRYTVVRAVPVLDQAGVLREWVGTHTDITAQRQADAALRASELSRRDALEIDRQAAEDKLRQNAALFARLVDQAPMGMYVVDAGFRLAQVNALAAPAFATVAPLIGRDFAEIMEIVWGPVVGAQCAQIFRHTLATGERYVSPPFTEQRFDLAIEQTFDWEAQRVSLPDGQHGVVCYFQEITARQRAERALGESEANMRLATEATGVGIWEWTAASGQIRWDAQMFRIYGIAPTSDGVVPAADWIGCVLPEHRARQQESLQGSVRKLGAASREFRIQRLNDGQLRTIESVETVREDGQGQIQWVVGTNLDVTAQRQMEDDLNMASRRKDEFLATLAHELRNPLAPVRNSLALMQRANGDAGVLAQARATMERQVAQMVRLIDDLLDVSRISRDQLTLTLERVDLASVVQLAVETCRPHCDLAGQVLRVVLPAGPVYLQADPARLAQVLGNLLNNASKYTPAGGRIELIAETLGDAVRVTVRDTGIGIPADMLSQVFDLFTQVDAARNLSKGGLGIGLALARRLTELHGGSIAARSEGRDRGSEFVLQLPLMAADHSPAAAAAVAATPSAPIARRILVVDDNLDSAESLTALLGLDGHDTQMAHDGLDAVEMAASFRPDVILLDIGLPRLNGHDVCRRIRAQGWSQGTVIIAMTGWGQADDRRKSSEAGFDNHCVKPVDPAVLANLLTQPRARPA